VQNPFFKQISHIGKLGDETALTRTRDINLRKSQRDARCQRMAGREDEKKKSPYRRVKAVRLGRALVRDGENTTDGSAFLTRCSTGGGREKAKSQRAEHTRNNFKR